MNFRGNESLLFCPSTMGASVSQISGVHESSENQLSPGAGESLEHHNEL